MSKRWSVQQSVAILIIALNFSLVPAAASGKDAAPADSALRLKTRSYDVGSTETFISKNAIRVNFNSDVYLVASAPQWRVVLCNRDLKKGLSMTLQQWLTHSPQWSFTPVDDWIRTEPLLEIGKKRVFGRPCIEFAFAQKYPNGKLLVKQDATRGKICIDTEKMCQWKPVIFFNA